MKLDFVSLAHPLRSLRLNLFLTAKNAKKTQSSQRKKRPICPRVRYTCQVEKGATAQVNTMQKTIFLVDDNGTNLSAAEDALEKQYRVITLSSAVKMFAVLEKITPDLILLDIEMPEMNGYQAMRQLKSNALHANIPVIFLTALIDDANEAHGIELGAVDFITKPFSEPVLLNRIKHHLYIDEIIRERTDHLVRLQNSIVFSLAEIVESRDACTGGHIERTTIYIDILINAMLESGVYAEEIRSWDLDSLISSARLHDVGKISISDTILNKQGPLTPEEFQVMQTHCAAGERIIGHMIRRTGEVEFLQKARLFAAYHHERWDGSGYPYKLKGTDIPLQGRIMAIVDVYDALTTARPYKKAMSNEEALSIIVSESDKHFDPKITKVFAGINDKIAAAATAADTHATHTGH